MTTRIERIESMLADAPDDVFLKYSLAMELRKEGISDRCTAVFQELTGAKVAYVPAFLMFAQYYSENEKITEAREVLRTGIEVARAQDDLHAAGEMGDLLTALGDA